MNSRARTCLSYWFPKLDGLPVPRTIIIKPDSFDSLSWCWDGTVPENLPSLIEGISRAAELIGYPVFIRTGQTSNKHEWNDSCYLTSPDQIPRRIYGLCEFSYTVDMIGLPTNVWVVREFLNLNSPFTAFNGMPIAREFRFFIVEGKIIHEQPYWPPFAIHDASLQNWQEALSEMSRLDAPDVMKARRLAYLASERFLIDGAWSVDVCETMDRGWMITDMAVAESSYMWDPATGEEMKYRDAQLRTR